LTSVFLGPEQAAKARKSTDKDHPTTRILAAIILEPWWGFHLFTEHGGFK
jgi:hypothetical protein